ncbi:MAG: hypothetical protein AB8E82_18625 [Aureispira sp.]
MAYDDPKTNLVVLEKYVQKNNTKQFTLEDASSVTGMPIIETEVAIKDLLGKYDSKLKVTENGDLIYDFGATLQRRHKKTWGERLQEFGQLLWKGFQVFYKLLTSLFLIIYFFIFLIFLIGLAVASEDGDGIGDAIAILFRVFLSIFEWNTIMGYNRRYYRQDDYGYKYQHYQEKPRVLKGRRRSKNPKDQKSFVASIYDFIFGPPRVELDPLANNQEVATFLREQKGLISTSEVQALAGWRREEAENFMTECLALFNGEANISDNGTLYGDFGQLIRAKNRTGEEPVVWYWDEYEPEHELTGNSKSRNGIIIAINTFNLIMSAVLLLGGYLGPMGLGLGWLGTTVLGIFPLVYSLSFFLIPLLRWFRLRPLQRQQRELNIRKRLMKVVFQTYDQGTDYIHEIPLDKLTEVANTQRTTEEKLDATTVDAVMRDTLSDLGGEAYLNKNNVIMYRFDLIAQELNDMDDLRAQKRTDTDLGDVIFEA